MSIVNPEKAMTSAEADRVMDELLSRYPFIRGRELGKTFFGRPLRALALGDGPRQVLFTAAHHANEWLTATVLLKFAEELAQAMASGGKIWGVPAENIRKLVTVHLVPMVNPDGVDQDTGAIRRDTADSDPHPSNSLSSPRGRGFGGSSGTGTAPGRIPPFPAG